MYSAKEIVGSNTMSVIDPKGVLRQAFFWKQSKDDKKQIEKLEGWNVYDYVDKFLPAFGFYSYRDSSCEESAEFQVIQRNGRFVQIIGGLNDPKTTEKRFHGHWIHLSISCGVGCDPPTTRTSKRH